MIPMDKKILLGGISMLAAGIILLVLLESTLSVGAPDMSEEATFELLVAQQENRELGTMAGILSAVGFLLVLVSFGAQRKRRGGPKKAPKKTEP